jgi:3D (Asp-Asp-Asp) domain-containing protein
MTAESTKKIASLLFMVLLSASLFTVVNTGADASEPAAVSSSDEVVAASGSNRFAVWQDDTPGNNEIFFRRSTDNGVTWQSRVNLSNNVGDSHQPLIRVSGSNVYVVWRQVGGSSADIFLRSSSDNGVTWKSPINISQSFGNSHLQQLAASGSSVYVAWQDDTLGNDEILFRRSADNGATWKQAVNLSNNPGRSETPQIAAAGSNVYVVWWQNSEDLKSSDIFLVRSTDRGATWKPKVNLSSNPGPSVFPEIAISGSNVYVVWTQENKAGTSVDVFFLRSADNGVTWGSKVNISNDGASAAPKIAVSGSNVYVVYQGNGLDVLFRRSTDNGATWKPKLNLSNDPEQSHLYKIAAAGSNVYVVWNDLGDGNDPPDVLFRRSADKGATWKAVTNLSNNPTNSSDPQVIAIGSEVYVVWSDLVSLNYDIFLKRSTNSGATWNPLKNLSNTAGSSFGPQIGI